ncbi:hypothetical protein AD998_14870 [bacterium 336/3]|nr:hypothetical protein AD998_14870 [bacterium 336/3]
MKKILLIILLNTIIIPWLYGQHSSKKPQTIYLENNFYFLTEVLGEIIAIKLIKDKDKKGNVWVYEHVFNNKIHYYASLHRYNNFIQFLNQELTHEKLLSLGKRYGTVKKELKPKVIQRIITFKISYDETISIPLDSSSMKNPTISKIVNFFENYRKEHGCEKRYYLYQLKRGETLEKIAKKENIEWTGLYDFNYNYKHEIGVNIHMFNKNISYEPKEGDSILLPCFLKKNE